MLICVEIFYFLRPICFLLLPLCKGFLRVMANSPNLCPTISSETFIGINDLPLCTVKVLSTKCGKTTDRRDHTLGVCLFNLVLLREPARRGVFTSENGIFQIDLGILRMCFVSLFFIY